MEPEGPLTLDQALALALERDPELAADELELRAAAARCQQAGLRPNPEASFEIENFGGDLPGASEAEITLTLAQRLELGGKRGARVELADSLASLVRWDREALRRDVAREVSTAFAEGLGAQARLEVAEQTLALAREVAQVVEQKVRAGAVSPVEATRARAAIATAEILAERAHRELDRSRRLLALSWGSTVPSFTSLAGSLDTLGTMATWPAVMAGLERNPDVARWADETRARRARLRAESSLRIPDLTASGGIRRLGESDATTFVAALGLPLPLLARNQGAIAEATVGVEKATAEERAARRRAERALADAVTRIETALAAVRRLRAAVLPATQSSYDEIRRGYELGKFTYLDLLEARRSLAEARAAEIDALVDLERGRAEAASLVGGRLE
jgi:cobalt-zinc-cadmium efflux system outer membrane protein